MLPLKPLGDEDGPSAPLRISLLKVILIISRGHFMLLPLLLFRGGFLSAGEKEGEAKTEERMETELKTGGEGPLKKGEVEERWG